MAERIAPATPGTRCDPALYALVHRGTPGDVAFYLRAARGAAKVLELGCGYGRLVVPLADCGHTVVGLDLDEGLLALARESLDQRPQATRDRVELVRGDMRDFDLPARFDRVFIPYSGLYCLASESELVACLRCVRQHLTPDGLVVWDAYAMDAAHADPGAESEVDSDAGGPLVTLQWNGSVYDVFERSRWDRDAQRLHVRYAYQPRGGGATHHAEIVHRYVLGSELERVSAQAGLRIVDRFGDFDGTGFSMESEHLVCVAKRR